MELNVGQPIKFYIDTNCINGKITKVHGDGTVDAHTMEGLIQHIPVDEIVGYKASALLRTKREKLMKASSFDTNLFTPALIQLLENRKSIAQKILRTQLTGEPLLVLENMYERYNTEIKLYLGI